MYNCEAVYLTLGALVGGIEIHPSQVYNFRSLPASGIKVFSPKFHSFLTNGGGGGPPNPYIHL